MPQGGFAGVACLRWSSALRMAVGMSDQLGKSDSGIAGHVLGSWLEQWRQNCVR